MCAYDNVWAYQIQYCKYGSLSRAFTVTLTQVLALKWL